MSEHDPLEHIVYISLPESKDLTIGNFTLDPSILLPVEIPGGESPHTLESLSWEMIAAGTLKVFAYRPDHPDIDYYRDFLHAVQPGLVQELLQIGVFKAQQQEYDLAEEMFLSLTNFAPHEEAPFVNLALVFEQKSMLYTNLGNQTPAEECAESAAETYKKGLRLHPDSLTLLHNGGSFYLKMENRHKGEELFNRFLEKAPGEDPRRDTIETLIKKSERQNEDDRLFAEAFDLVKMNREEEGIERITSFLERNPNIWNAWFLLGWAHRRLGNYKKGREAFEKSIAIDKTQPDTFNELSICLMEMSEHKEARKYLEQALALEPENTKVISNLGILALKTGDKDQALGFFRTVLETDPNDEIAKKYIEFIEKNH